MQTVKYDLENNHLSDDLLDQYRAGLLDGEQDILIAIKSHLAHCPDCQKKHQQWDTLAKAIQPAEATSGLHQAFAAQRQATLIAHRNKARYLPAVAIAASLFFAVIGVSVFTVTQPPSAPSEEQIAAENKEILNDIDFYIWLSQHQSVTDGNEGNT